MDRRTAVGAISGLFIVPNFTIGRMRFRYAYRKALWQQRVAGKITPKQHRRYWLAAMNYERYFYKKKRGTFIGHLERECQEVARASGAFLDDLSDWWNRLVAWMVENWDVVMKVLLTLVVLLEKPEHAPN